MKKSIIFIAMICMLGGCGNNEDESTPIDREDTVTEEPTVDEPIEDEEIPSKSDEDLPVEEPVEETPPVDKPTVVESAPQSEPSAVESFTVAIVPDSVSTIDLTIRYTNNTNEEQSYGYAYKLEQKKDDKWVDITVYVNVDGESAIAYPNQNSDYTIEFVQVLENGIYRVTVDNPKDPMEFEISSTTPVKSHPNAPPQPDGVSSPNPKEDIQDNSLYEDGKIILSQTSIQGVSQVVVVEDSESKKTIIGYADSMETSTYNRENTPPGSGYTGITVKIHRNDVIEEYFFTDWVKDGHHLGKNPQATEVFSWTIIDEDAVPFLLTLFG